MKKQSSLQTLMNYAGKYKILTYLSWIMSAISALIGLIPYIYVYMVIEEVLKVAPDFRKADNLTHYGWMAVMFAVITIIVYMAALMCSHISAFRIAANMRKAILEYIAKLPMGAIEAFGSGRARKIIADSTGATETYLAHQLPDKAGAMATPVGLLALLMFFDWKLGLLSLLPVALGFALMGKMTGAGMKAKMEEYQNSLDDMSNEAVEYIRGMAIVKTFGQTIFSFRRFKDAIDNYKKWVISYTVDLRKPMMFYTTAINAVFAFLIAAALWVTKDGVSQEFLLNLVFYIIITPVISLTLTKIMFMSENQMIVADALKRVDSILELEPLGSPKGKIKLQDCSISYDHVSFSYDGKKKVIDDVNLNVETGETVAFVGPSGGGKTTLANLTSRFFDVDSGAIKIGGKNLKDIPKEELMEKVSFVFQDSHLLKMSILDNVKIGRPEATEEEVHDAIINAQCAGIIEKFPNGLHTMIGTNGVYLSGGEMQRIAIARMILKNSPVIILDEASAFADPDNEIKIQQALSHLTKNKTVVMIAHRLSTVKNVDKICVLKDGEIVESGKHEELIRRNGVYADMWNEYNKSAMWKVETAEEKEA